MGKTDPDIAHHAALDERMVRAAREIKVLTLASWPATTATAFLAGYARGVTLLPQVTYPKHDFSEARTELAAIAREADASHPLGQYLIDATGSWETAARLCESLGTPAVSELSQQLYGSVDAPLPGNGPSARVAARHFIQIADRFDRELVSPAEQVEISATALQLQLQGDLDDYFNERMIEVVLDPDLIAKAAAGATRIRLRARRGGLHRRIPAVPGRRPDAERGFCIRPARVPRCADHRRTCLHQGHRLPARHDRRSGHDRRHGLCRYLSLLMA